MEYYQSYVSVSDLASRIRDSAKTGVKPSVQSGLGTRLNKAANNSQTDDFDRIRAEYINNIQEMFTGVRESQVSDQEAYLEGLKSLESIKGPAQTPTQSRFPGSGSYVAYESEAATRIKTKLMDRGMPEHIAEGFVMNFADESGLSSLINEKNPTVKGSRGGFGLYQLTGPRRKAYEAYAQMQGINVNDPMEQEDAQLSFLMEELNGAEKENWDVIQTADDAGTAAAYIVREFLRPDKKHMNSRVINYTGRSSPYITEPTQKP